MEVYKDSENSNLGPNDKFDDTYKFFTRDFEFVNHDYIKNLLTQNTGFLVIGVIGKQTVGKSFILNMLSNNMSDSRSKPFETASVSDLLNFNQKTIGIDIHITRDRIILLDAQPILNIGHLGVSMEKEKKIKVFSNDDTENESKIKMSYSPDILSIQIVSYLLSVCHTVLVVDDRALNYRLLRLLDLAHRLKPWISGNPAHLPLDEPRNMPINRFEFHSEFHDYVAQMVMVENMCHQRDFSAQQLIEQSECISQVLIGYRLRTDEQLALLGWLRDTRMSPSSRQASKVKRRIDCQPDRAQPNAVGVAPTDCQKSENDSDEDNQPRRDDEDVSVSAAVSVVPNEGGLSDLDDDDLIEHRLNRSIHRPIKLVKIPVLDDDELEFEREARALQKAVLRLPRKHFCVTQSERFTELCWFEYAIEMWHSIRNSNSFTDFFYSYSSSLIGDL